ncbi:MAG TPA: 3-phosphoshikimate 1-carboxyvinyltransferase, partial [Acidobacteria bacterium]|nr:3-phosphoshikimate 1-carboxyvinyltransferase [Acidobacteriota bacterium]
MRLVGPRRGLRARVRVPGSKSLTNRALILAAAAGGGRIVGPLDCEDTRLLAAALERAGWPVEWAGERIEVGARRPVDGTVTLHLGNSGTGARLLMGLLATVPGRFVVDGVERLRERPMAPLLDALAGLGVPVEAAPGDRLPVLIEGGTVAGGPVVLAPGPSSQFVSSLLLAAPRMERGLELVLEGPVPSRPYLELTRRVLERFGVAVEVSGDLRRWKVAGELTAGRAFEVEGDWSAAAFFVAAAAVAGGTVEIEGVDPASPQGDRRVLDVVAGAGCRVEASDGGVAVSGPVRRPLEADFTDTPDLFPALAVVAA